MSDVGDIACSDASERAIYLPGEERPSELGTPFLFIGLFCPRENYVYTASQSQTSENVSGLDLDKKDKTELANSSAKVTTKLCEDGLNFMEWKSAVIEVAVIKNVHEALQKAKPKTVADILYMALIAGSIPEDLRSKARGHASAFDAFNWISSLYVGGTNTEVNDLWVYQLA
jgi:hypothetical protein